MGRLQDLRCRGDGNAALSWPFPVRPRQRDAVSTDAVQETAPRTSSPHGFSQENTQHQQQKTPGYSN